MSDVPQSYGPGRHFDPESDRWVADPVRGSPEHAAYVRRMQEEADEERARQLAVGRLTRDEIQARYAAKDDDVRGLYVPKHVLVIGQVIRTVTSTISALGTLVILAHVYGLL